ncbi:MAG: purine-nucleoside phosphorylase [Candidatus Sumerlaeaceae bacterium]|nr:purine-nucleoside phosphorylase [Candidatus Sumerlaeaceae bacterium]
MTTEQALEPRIAGKVEDLRGAIRAALPGKVEVAIIAGSGLGGFARGVEASASVSYSDLPHVGAATVQGHSGTLVMGRAAGVPLVLLNGRRHIYEGIALDEATVLLRAVLLETGARIVIISNAAGGLNPTFDVADLMMLSDHINWMFRNPLIGPNKEDWGPRFPDASDVYSRRLRGLARDAAVEAGITLREGVYLAGHGPSYETRAEVRMLRTVIGADAVGMSTAPEALVAAHMGREVLGLSVITNLLTDPAITTHEEVMENSKKAEANFKKLLETLLPKLVKG